ncbi:olfactory receptor 6M1-like [Pelobates fuscus]|uniref:olfactory receptor 6M1-like n=1 Tax=Pelobates fuscus TaxID=191477 RepID=UPI002FE4B569
MENGSNVLSFILFACHMTFAYRVTSTLLLLLTYLMTLSGNILIILLIWKSHHLHSPMYMFLTNISFLEIWFTSTVMPKLLSILAYENRAISTNGCLTQCYFYFCLGTAELFLLTVMSFDRYVAVCYPLKYVNVMRTEFCLKLSLGCWIGGFAFNIVQTILVADLPFCKSNIIDHFFCDVEPLLILACSDTSLIKIINLISSAVVVFGSLVCIVISYLHIISAIFKVSTVKSRWKSFSTCVSHLVLVFIVYGSSLFLCLRKTTGSMDFSKLSAFLTGIVTPLLNPFVYTLRNNQVKEALKQLLSGKTMTL